MAVRVVRAGSITPCAAEADTAEAGAIEADAIEAAAVETDTIGSDLIEAGALETAAEEKVWVRIDVSDTGVGISSEAMARLFTPFRQVDDSSCRKHGGTGLGLSICRSLAALMGGCISEGGEGGCDAVWGVGGAGGGLGRGRERKEMEGCREQEVERGGGKGRRRVEGTGPLSCLPPFWHVQQQQQVEDENEQQQQQQQWPQGDMCGEGEQMGGGEGMEEGREGGEAGNTCRLDANGGAGLWIPDIRGEIWKVQRERLLQGGPRECAKGVDLKLRRMGRGLKELQRWEQEWK
ncbi:unnamed protein product [Closterium sp. NIES-65]|nr:unnamed protein product [Closterium sp. NIES-65]